MTDDPDDVTETRIRTWSIPIAMVVAVGFHAWPTGHWLQRTFLSMMVHELGHAVTGWTTGYAALPTVWKTLIPASRSLFVTALIVAAAGYIGWRAWQADRKGIVALVAAIGGFALVGAFGTSEDRAQEAITFGGDAGAMILGTLLMLTMFAGEDSRLRTNQLRWGFLVIGAAAFVDTFATWWTARRDPSAIPFGEIEGVGLSDPSKLQETFGWSERHIVGRYLTVGALCLVALALVWGRHVLRARQRTQPR